MNTPGSDNRKPQTSDANVYANAIELLQDLIQVPSLTPISSDLSGAAASSLDLLQAYLQQHGAECERLVFDDAFGKWHYAVDNLYAEWTFGAGEKHLCFMGHTDVVPPGDLEKWSSNPYSGHVEDGWIYGRGATDMKGAVAAFSVAAAEAIKSLQGKSFKLSLLITTDEEWVAENGSKKVLKWLKDNGKSIDAFVVGEPSSNDLFGSHIKVGRRGSLCGNITAEGVQGHAAYKDLFENPNRALSLACTILNGYQWRNNSEYFPKTNLEVVAQLSGAVDITSIVPATAVAYWNIRFTPEYTVEELVGLIRDQFLTPPPWAKAHADVESLKKLTVTANIDTASHPYFSKPRELAALTRTAVHKVTGLMPEIDAHGGTTDGRFVHDYFPDAQIVELGVPEKGGQINRVIPADYGSRGGMHQVDERCSVKDIEDLLLCYGEIIQLYSSQ